MRPLICCRSPRCRTQRLTCMLMETSLLLSMDTTLCQPLYIWVGVRHTFTQMSRLTFWIIIGAMLTLWHQWRSWAMSTVKQGFDSTQLCNWMGCSTQQLTPFKLATEEFLPDTYCSRCTGWHSLRSIPNEKSAIRTITLSTGSRTPQVLCFFPRRVWQPTRWKGSIKMTNLNCSSLIWSIRYLASQSGNASSNTQPIGHRITKSILTL